MKKSVWKLLCCIIVFLFCFMLLEGRLVVKATETSSVDTMKVEIFGSYNQASAKDIFQMVNDFRTGEDAWYWDENNTQKIENLNLTPLVYDYDLQAIAEQRAAEIALSYSHTRPNGEDCFSAYSSSGQTYWKMAENIAAGQIYAKDVMEDWKEELDKYEGQGHRRNMLDSEVNAIGIASFTVDNKVFWVQEFARVENPNTTPSGNEENDDDTRYVLVEVDISDNSGTALSNLRMSPSVMGLAPGNERRIPNVLADIVMEDSYLKEKRNVYIQDCQWESSNEEIVEIIDGSTGILMIQAPGPMGMTVLSTTVMGKTVSAKVYVTSDGELDMDQMEVIPIDEEHFPDEAFRQYISSYVDASEEGYLDTERIEITTEMMISDECGIISDLTGIEYFTNLNCLELDGHSIKSFDVSQNPTLEEVGFINCAQLKEVDFSTSSFLKSIELNNLPRLENVQLPETKELTWVKVTNVPGIKSLDMSDYKNLNVFVSNEQKFDSLKFDGCTNLSTLDVRCSGLKNLSIKGCSALEEIDCDNNELKSLDVSGLRQLTRLYCYDNQLEYLGLGENVRLEDVKCHKNKLKSLDVQAFTLLRNLDCANNQLNALLVGNDKLERLSCSNNLMNSLKLADCPNLQYLICDGCPLRELDVTNNPKLIKLNCCGGCGEIFSSIKGLNKLTELKMLSAENGQLTSLDLSQCKKLEVLILSGNKKLSSLNLTACKELLRLWIQQTSISTIDLSQNTKLMDLITRESSLSQLNLSANTDLREINVESCQLTSLDVSPCKKLVNLDCNNNHISKLNLKGCSELRMLKCSENSLFNLDISSNKKIGLISFTELQYEDEVGNQVQQHYSDLLYQYDAMDVLQDDYKEKLLDYDYRALDYDFFAFGEDDPEETQENEQETDSQATTYSENSTEGKIMSSEAKPELYVLQYFDVPASAIVGGSIDLSKFVDVSGFDASKIGKTHHISVKGTRLVITGQVNRMYFDYYKPYFWDQFNNVKIPLRFVFQLTEEAQNKLIDNMSYPGIEDYTGVYDGKNHTVKLVDIPKDATVQYRTSEKENWSSVKPTRKKVGMTRVYCKISRPDWNDQYEFGDITIKPKGTSIKKIIAGKKSFVIKWKKQTAETTGYQIRYATKSSMAGAKIKTISKYKKVSQKVTKLKSKKKYYVQIRTYKNVGGTKYYSSWSGKKKIKVK